MSVGVLPGAAEKCQVAGLPVGGDQTWCVSSGAALTAESQLSVWLHHHSVTCCNSPGSAQTSGWFSVRVYRDSY